MKRIIPIAGIYLGLILCIFCEAQTEKTDTNYIKKLYDEAFDYNFTNIDTVEIFVSEIHKLSDKLGYKRGHLSANNLSAINNILKGEYQTVETMQVIYATI